MPVKPKDLFTEGAAVRLAGDNVIGCETDGACVLLGDAVAPGVIAETTDQWHGNPTSVRVGAVHRGVLRPLGQLGIPWTHFDG